MNKTSDFPEHWLRAAGSLLDVLRRLARHGMALTVEHKLRAHDVIGAPSEIVPDGADVVGKRAVIPNTVMIRITGGNQIGRMREVVPGNWTGG